MEATGVYWKPIYNVLEGQMQVIVINAEHIKAVPGRKTDVKDAERIATLAQHGLVRGSFIPERPQRELRELTRFRTALVQDRTRAINRLQKTLEAGNIKLASVLSDVMVSPASACWRPCSQGSKTPNNSLAWPTAVSEPSTRS